MMIPIDPSLQTDKFPFAPEENNFHIFLNLHRMKMHENTSHLSLLTKITREMLKQTIFGDIEEAHENR
jgi:hypothetical protein